MRGVFARFVPHLLPFVEPARRGLVDIKSIGVDIGQRILERFQALVIVVRT